MPLRVLLLKWFNIISKMIVLITYHAQICPQKFLAVMTPRYIAFILTKNWFGQSWAGMGHWYYMGRWVNVWNFRKTKFFIQNFNIFFCFENDLKCYFWIPHPKIYKSTNFHKNSVNQTQNMNENALPSISNMAVKRTKEKDCGPNF